MNASEGILEQEKNGRPDRGDRAATAGSLFGALAMTSCCILPLVLVSFGVGGVWIAQLTALYAYKWITFSVAAAFIAWGFWKVYRPLDGACPSDGACARPINRRFMKGSLWLATVVVLIAVIFPYLTPYILSY